MQLQNRYRGAMLGLAAGDAVGTTVEFRPRGSFQPVRDMVGGGPFGLKPGEWTDDTSMALCLAESLVSRRGFDAADQMRRYCRWRDTGYLASNGRCFDIGLTVSAALRRFEESGEPFAGSPDPRTAGNGSLMRLAPAVLFGYPDAREAERLAAESSRTTHGAAESIDACRLFARMLCRALSGAPKEAVLLGDAERFAGEPAIAAIARGGYLRKSEDEVRGSGYVVESLEAALWAFAGADSFEEAVLRAVNLGDDADTTAAITGQLAGAYWGADGIPRRWRERLALRDLIERLADDLLALAVARNRSG